MSHDILPAHLPKKSLGQHFLIHEGVQDKIVEACRLQPDDVILEIGPGKGAITRKISERVKGVIAIEKDRLLAPALKESFEGSNVTVIEADVLAYDFAQLPRRLKCVGNLPYNAAASIIEKILTSERFTEMFAMVQLEQGERMIAAPGGKEYGSLSCFVQYYSRVKKVLDIRPSAFAPPPKVQSAFLSFEIYAPQERPIQNVEAEYLFKVIRTAFLQRRKTILNALGGMCSKNDLAALLERLEIPARTRPEQISLEDYVRMARELKSKSREV